MKPQKHFFLTQVLIYTISVTTLLSLLSLTPNFLFHNTFASESPAFDQVLLQDKKTANQTDWIQTHGNNSTDLKSDYTNILAVDYSGDGKTLDTTYWLASNSENASIYNQHLKKIRYGMLIAIVSLPQNSGYNGANYDFSIEEVDGKWSEYLYQLSSTDARALVYSKLNYTESYNSTTIGPGYVKLRLDLASIHSPASYGLSFYTAESLASNEVRDFTRWAGVPPFIINTVTDPKDVVLRQGQV